MDARQTRAWLVKRSLAWPQVSTWGGAQSSSEVPNEAKPIPGLREVMSWEGKNGLRMEIAHSSDSLLSLLRPSPHQLPWEAE